MLRFDTAEIYRVLQVPLAEVLDERDIGLKVDQFKLLLVLGTGPCTAARSSCGALVLLHRVAEDVLDGRIA